MNPSNGSPSGLVEIKGLSVRAKGRDLDAADRANGIEWQGEVYVECDVFRTVPVSFDPENKAVRVSETSREIDVTFGPRESTARVPGTSRTWGEWENGHTKETLMGRIGGVPVFAADPLTSFASPALKLTIRNGEWQWCVSGATKPDPAIIPKQDASGP
jgi:hypothetical protein